MQSQKKWLRLVGGGGVELGSWQQLSGISKKNFALFRFTGNISCSMINTLLAKARDVEQGEALLLCPAAFQTSHCIHQNFCKQQYKNYREKLCGGK